MSLTTRRVSACSPGSCANLKATIWLGGLRAHPRLLHASFETPGQFVSRWMRRSHTLLQESPAFAAAMQHWVRNCTASITMMMSHARPRRWSRTLAWASWKLLDRWVAAAAARGRWAPAVPSRWARFLRFALPSRMFCLLWCTRLCLRRAPRRPGSNTAPAVRGGSRPPCTMLVLAWQAAVSASKLHSEALPIERGVGSHTLRWIEFTRVGSSMPSLESQ